MNTITPDLLTEADIPALMKHISKRMRTASAELLTAEEELQLSSLAQEGSELARMALYRAGEQEARQLARSWRQDNFSEDAESEALACLWCCTGSFRSGKNARWRTYYTTCINNELHKFCRNLYGATQLPGSAESDLRTILDGIDRYKAADYCLGAKTAPTTQELAETLGMSTKRVRELRYLTDFQVSTDNYFFNEEGEERQFARLQFAASETADSALCRSDFSSEVMRVLSRFPERNRAIFMALYPLSDGEALSKAEVAQLYGVSPQRVGQIEQQVLAALRQSKAIAQYAGMAA